MRILTLCNSSIDDTPTYVMVEFFCILHDRRQDVLGQVHIVLPLIPESCSVYYGIVFDALGAFLIKFNLLRMEIFYITLLHKSAERMTTQL